MKCTLASCPGSYESREVLHAVRHRGAVVVIDHVPAEVCNVCGDVLLSPDTIRHIERILDQRSTPAESVPLYRYA